MNYSRQSYSRNSRTFRGWNSALMLTNSIQILPNLPFNVGIRHSHGIASLSTQFLELKDTFNIIDNYTRLDMAFDWPVNIQWNISYIGKNLGENHIEGLSEQFTCPPMPVAPYGIIKVSYKY